MTNAQTWWQWTFELSPTVLSENFIFILCTLKICILFSNYVYCVLAFYFCALFVCNVLIFFLVILVFRGYCCFCCWKGNCHKKRHSSHSTHMIIDCGYAERLSLHSNSKVSQSTLNCLWSILCVFFFVYSAWKYLRGDTFTQKKKTHTHTHSVYNSFNYIQIQICFGSNNNSCHWMIVLCIQCQCVPLDFFPLSRYDNYLHSAKALMCTCIQRWHIWFAWKENAFYMMVWLGE